MKRAIRIAQLTAEHVDAVATLHALCFDDAWGADAIAAAVAPSAGFGLVAVAPRRAMPVGFILCRVADGECELLSIGVVPDQRRSGWAKELLTAALAEARRLGAVSAVLEVARDNAPAIVLYRSVGFVVVGGRRAYYRCAGRRSDAHIMRLHRASREHPPDRRAPLSNRDQQSIDGRGVRFRLE